MRWLLSFLKCDYYILRKEELKIKGYTYLETIFAITLLSIFLVPILWGLSSINNNMILANEEYISLAQGKNILESAKKSVKLSEVGYIENSFSNGLTLSEFLLPSGFSEESENYIYRLTFLEINTNDKKEYVFVDKNIEGVIQEVSILTENQYLFESLKEESKADLIIKDDLVLKGNEFVNISSNTLSLFFNYLSKDITIELHLDLNTYEEIVIENQSSNDIYLNIYADSFDYETLKYKGLGRLVSEKIKYPNLENYIILVDIYDKNSNFIKRLGATI